MLNLGEVTRDAYFAYLETDQPQLVEAYRAIYRSRYAPATYEARVDAGVTAAKRGIAFTPPATIAPRPPRELTLF